MPVERQLTVMFTDMKGYTARTARSSRGDLLRLLREHDQVVLPILELRGGRLIKTIGDALMMTFVNPTNAVKAAAEVQEALVDYNIGRPKSERIEIRIGMHFGDLTEVDGDLFGTTVNIAARVESIASPGSVYFTQAVMDELRQGTCEAVFLGRQRLKGVPEAVGIFRVARGGKRAEWEARWSVFRHSRVAKFVENTMRLVALMCFLFMLGAGILVSNVQLCLAAVVGALSLAPAGWAAIARFRPLFGAVSAALVFTSLSAFVSDTQQHLDDLAMHLQDDGPAAVSDLDAAGIYFISMGSAMGQMLLDPDQVLPATFAARLRWGMLSSSPRRVRMHTGFPMGSPRVIRPLSSLTYRLGKRNTPQNMATKTINLRGDQLFAGLPMWRLAMAAQSKKSRDKWRIYAVADGEVAYGLGDRATLMDHGSWYLQADTGLIVLLQDRGWLKPYRVRLAWSVGATDSRLRGHNTLGLR